MNWPRTLAVYANVMRVLVLAAMAAILAGHAVPTSQALDQPPASAQPPLPSAPAVASPAAPTGPSLWQNRWWIEKTARLLRGGEGLGPNDDIDALVRLPEEEIARRFMNDPRFGDTILDFNMFYLGFKQDYLKEGGLYRRSAYDFSNAVAAAQALLTGGDYLKLFDLEGPFFMPPLPLVADDPPAPEDAGLSLEALRLKATSEVEEIFLKLHEMGRKAPPVDSYCDEFKKIVDDSSAIHDQLERAFNDSETFIVMLRGRFLSEPLAILGRAHWEQCVEKPKAQADLGHLTAAAFAALDRYHRVFAEMFKFEPARYQPRSVLDFKTFDLSVVGMNKWLAFGFEQSSTLKNSSTNYNRRRGAYMLKRFFCDDLTPVGFEAPQEHVAGAHGSDTPCFACHFKLDPMAGFFRSHGTYFYDFKAEDLVEFDDGATTNREKYEGAWRSAKGSAHKWNTGYVRSPRFEDQNEYGVTIADLTKIIRNAPEAKRCLMKRLFEYLVAEEQTIDGGYLDELARTFEQEAAQNSSMAMRNAIVRIVLSNSYRQVNADPRACYDHAAGARLDNAPPCRVAFILQKNCAQCHAGPNGNAGLDLTAWIPAPDGKGRTFPHLDSRRNQLAAHETLTRMAERLSSTDPAVRMPKLMVMPGHERQELFLWVQEELARIAKAERR